MVSSVINCCFPLEEQDKGTENREYGTCEAADIAYIVEYTVDLAADFWQVSLEYVGYYHMNVVWVVPRAENALSYVEQLMRICSQTNVNIVIVELEPGQRHIEVIIRSDLRANNVPGQLWILVYL